MWRSETAGHLDKVRSLDLQQRRYDQASEGVNLRRYERCSRRKATDDSAWYQLLTSQPSELACMDFVSLEESKMGVETILVVTDHLTWYSAAIQIPNPTAK